MKDGKIADCADGRFADGQSVFSTLCSEELLGKHNLIHVMCISFSSYASLRRKYINLGGLPFS